MSEWDRKFARMVAETERHLASVKRQLRSPSSSRSVRTTPRRTKTASSPYLGNTGQTSPSSLPRSSLEKPALSSLNMSSLPKRTVSFDIASHSSTGISLLGEKIRNQQKDIIALRESLNGMQFYLKQQHNHIMSLKDEMHTLQLKLSEEGGCRRREDTKLQQFKREITVELEALKKRVQNILLGSSGYHVTSRENYSLSDENELRKSNVVTSLHKEISSIKSKLATQGSKVGIMANQLREMKRSQDDVTKVASDVEQWRKTEDLLSSRKMGVVSEQNSQLQRLRDLISSLESRLLSVEKSFPTNKATPTNTSTPFQSHATKRHAHSSMVHSDPITMSDLSVSPIGVAAASKFHPVHGNFGKGARVKASSTLRESLSRVGRYEGFVDRDLMSESSELGSDLDGHTLSCSLELMSDFEVSEDLNSDLPDTDDTISLSNLTR